MHFKLNKKTIYILTLVFVIIVSVVVHWRWVFTGNIFTSGDWGFQFKDTAATLRIDYFSLWLSDSSFGRLLLDSGQAPTYAAYGILAKYLNVDFALSERIIHMWPIIIAAPTGSYILIRRYIKGNFASIVGAFVYSFNTYFLILQTGQLTLAGAYAFVPFALYFFIKSLEIKRLSYAILAGLALSVVSAYEPRVGYITLACLFGYAVWLICYSLMVITTKKEKLPTNRLSIELKGSNRKSDTVTRSQRRFTQFIIPLKTVLSTLTSKPFFKIYLFAAIPIIVYSLLNAYWILGLAKTSALTNNQLFSKGLFGSDFFDIGHALALYHPYWNGSLPIAFIVNPIPVFAWVLPITAFFGLYYYRKNKLVLYFGLLALIGILLAKQVAPPFTALYGWLYGNLPGFSAFREASKFYLIICVAYSFLIAAALQEIKQLRVQWLKQQGRHLYLVLGSLVCLLLFSYTMPLINGSVGTLFKARNIPAEYQHLNSILASDSTFSRVFWLPSISRWGLYNSTHPRLGSIDTVQGAWNDFLVEGDSQYPTLQDQASGLFNKSFTGDLFTAANIKYVVVPARDAANDDDFFKYYGDNPQYYISLLDRQPWLKKISGEKEPVAIYQNTHYQSYISSTSSMLNFSSTKDLSSLYSFTQQQLQGQAFDFNAKDDGTQNKIPGTTVQELSDNVKAASFSAGKLALFRQGPGSGKLSMNINKPTISYSFSGNQLNLIESSNDAININDKPVAKHTPDKTILSLDLQSSKQYYLDNDGNLARIVLGKNAYLGSSDSRLIFYSVSGPNLVQNPSFENGLWQKHVDDCNNYDDGGAISMSLDTTNQTSGKKSLQLSAVKHTACTQSQPIPVLPNTAYRFAFDYRANNTRKMAYTITFNDAKKTIINATVNVSGNDWKHTESAVSTPIGATSAIIKFLGFPDDQLKNKATTNFDSVVLQPLTLENTATADQTPKYTTMQLHDGDKVTYEDKSYNYSNAIQNPSFENGLWQKHVDDCNNYDGNPIISMKLSNDASVGEKSLELDAIRHVACTQQNHIPVQENTPYYFSLDYKGTNGSTAAYRVTFNDTNRTAISRQLPIKKADWKTFSQYIKVPSGATEMSVSLYSYGTDKGDVQVATKYDNFQLIKVPPIVDLYYYSHQPIEKLTTPKSTSYQTISPTRKNVQVTGAMTPFYLRMSETFNPSWKLILSNQKINGLSAYLPLQDPDVVSDNHHFKLSDTFNGWYIDPAQLCKNMPEGCKKNADGSYDLQLVAEFTPQRWFYVGSAISGVTLVAAVSYLGLSFYRKRRAAKPAKADKVVYRAKH